MRAERRYGWLLGCCVLMMIVLAGCGGAGGQGQDPAAVKIELLSDPSPVKSGQNAKLIVQITGLLTEEGAQVQFDVRKLNNEGLPDFLDATAEGDGKYSAETSFKDPGEYSIYVHLYQEELHITKKKQLKVE
ncbi:FixH family protein [Paenibacillus sp. GCM10027626]|uniref:FixH family protein n=1 Tax=Paenibacillus sp. GCM10027626 TaxID=3273411 RepID=UPI0036350F47